MLFYKGLKIREFLPLSATRYSFNIYKESCERAKNIKEPTIQWNLLQTYRNLKIYFQIISLQSLIVKRITHKKWFAFWHIKKIIPILRLLDWYKEKEEKKEIDINKNLDDLACSIAASHPGTTPRMVLNDFTINQVGEFQKQKLAIQIRELTTKLLISCAPHGKEAMKSINDMIKKLKSGLEKIPKQLQNVTEQKRKFIPISACIPRVKIC
jgi:hypothetical protein